MTTVVSRFKHHVSFDEDTRYTWCIIYQNTRTGITECVHIINDVTEATIKSKMREPKGCKVLTMFRSEETDHLFNKFEELTGCVLSQHKEIIFTYDPKEGNYIINVL